MSPSEVLNTLTMTTATRRASTRNYQTDKQDRHWTPWRRCMRCRHSPYSYFFHFHDRHVERQIGRADFFYHLFAIYNLVANWQLAQTIF
jgi:hypothetical protein